MAQNQMQVKRTLWCEFTRFPLCWTAAKGALEIAVQGGFGLNQGGRMVNEPSELAPPVTAAPQKAAFVAPFLWQRSACSSVGEAARQGRWDVVLRLMTGPGAHADRAGIEALKSWQVSEQVVSRFARRMAWIAPYYRGFAGLDRSQVTNGTLDRYLHGALQPVIDRRPAATHFAEKLLDSSRPVTERELLVAAIAGDKRLAPSTGLRMLGEAQLRRGRLLEAAWLFDASLAAPTQPLEEVRHVRNRQVTILRDYRRHKIVCYRGRFFGFYLGAPAVILGPYEGFSLQAKHAVAMILASFLSAQQHHRLLKAYGAARGALHRAALHCLKPFGRSVHPGQDGLQPSLPALPSASPAPGTSQPRPGLRSLRSDSGVTDKPRRTILRDMAHLPGFAAGGLYRLRYWRRYPVFAGDSFQEVLASIDAAIASGRAKTS
jgi:hypothetical protein